MIEINKTFYFNMLIKTWKSVHLSCRKFQYLYG